MNNILTVHCLFAYLFPIKLKKQTLKKNGSETLKALEKNLKS